MNLAIPCTGNTKPSPKHCNKNATEYVFLCPDIPGQKPEKLDTVGPRQTYKNKCSDFGTKRSQVQILSPRPENPLKSAYFSGFFIQIGQRARKQPFFYNYFATIFKKAKGSQSTRYSRFTRTIYYTLHYVRYCHELCAKRNAGSGSLRLASNGRILKGSFQVLHGA